MGRRKQYDRDLVIQRAMDLFWKSGYGGTSMSSLVEHTQLNKRSMYDEFGDKAGLFCEAINKYCDKVESSLDALLENSQSRISDANNTKKSRNGYPESPDETLGSFFSHQTGLTRSKGCLACNCLAEFNKLPPNARQRIKKYFVFVENHFDKALDDPHPNDNTPQDIIINKEKRIKQLVLLAIGNAMYNRLGDPLAMDVILHS